MSLPNTPVKKDTMKIPSVAIERSAQRDRGDLHLTESWSAPGYLEGTEQESKSRKWKSPITPVIPSTKTLVLFLIWGFI